jgi:hypothetical protein
MKKGGPKAALARRFGESNTGEPFRRSFEAYRNQQGD